MASESVMTMGPKQSYLDGRAETRTIEDGIGREFFPMAEAGLTSYFSLL